MAMDHDPSMDKTALKGPGISMKNHFLKGDTDSQISFDSSQTSQ